MKRIALLFGILLIAACQLVTEMESKNKAWRPADYRVLEADLWGWQLSRQKAKFEAFITKAATERLIAADDKKAMKLIHRFFPNASHFEEQPFSLEPLASRDSFLLLLYEFVGDEQGTNQMYLGSFRKSGFVIDLLEMLPLSSEAQLSLDMLEGDMLKIEYSGYRIRSEYPNFQNETGPTVRPVAFQKGADESIEQDFSGTKYFRVHPNGKMEAIADKELKDITRKLPELSARIFSMEELEEMNPKEVKRMCKELFASHDLVFKEESLINFLKKQGWYDTDATFQTSSLNELEKINLDTVLDLDWVLE